MPTLRIVKRDRTIIEAILDQEDYGEAVGWRWHMAGGKGRVGKYVRRVDGVYLHRWVAHRMGLIATVAPETAQGRWSISIDHRNGNKLDNRRTNLRLLDRPAQMLNLADRPRSTNSSGYRGVNYAARPGRQKRWRAYAQGKTLGWYATVEEAAAARQRWDQEHTKE
jgi:hypothetical protein